MCAWRIGRTLFSWVGYSKDIDGESFRKEGRKEERKKDKIVACERKDSLDLYGSVLCFVLDRLRWYTDHIGLEKIHFSNYIFRLLVGLYFWGFGE